jgi:hypothetical protein
MRVKVWLAICGVMSLGPSGFLTWTQYIRFAGRGQLFGGWWLGIGDRGDTLKNKCFMAHKINSMVKCDVYIIL